MIEIRAQGNLSINEQKEITLSVNRIVEKLEGVKQLYGYSSATNYVPFGSDVSRDQISTILVELVPRSERSSGSREIFRTIREKTKSIPGIFVTGQEMEQGPTGENLAKRGTRLGERRPEQVCSSCLLYTSPSPRDLSTSRMPSSA